MAIVPALFAKLKEIRETFPEATLIAGNVATAEATKALYDVGVTLSKLVLDLVQFVQHVSLLVLVFLN